MGWTGGTWAVDAATGVPAGAGPGARSIPHGAHAGAGSCAVPSRVARWRRRVRRERSPARAVARRRSVVPFAPCGTSGSSSSTTARRCAAGSARHNGPTVQQHLEEALAQAAHARGRRSPARRAPMPACTRAVRSRAFAPSARSRCTASGAGSTRCCPTRSRSATRRGRRRLPSAVLGDRQALPLHDPRARRSLAALARPRLAPSRAALISSAMREAARGADRRARLRGVPGGRLHAPRPRSRADRSRSTWSRRRTTCSTSMSAAMRSSATWSASWSGP